MSDSPLIMPFGWRHRMIARDANEPHRGAAPLELFFDLCFVVAVAQAGARLHHAFAEGNVGSGVLSFAAVFFAIWWAWMNVTWFASAFDTDDVPYRIAVFIQITGALILAAGVPRAFDSHDFVVATAGYVVMRMALVANWLRLAVSERPYRTTALRFATGVSVCQLGWVSLLTLPDGAQMWGWLLLVPTELAVPIWAEHARRTPWHPRHVAERYGLFTIIVLGESILAATFAIQSALDSDQSVSGLYEIAAGGALTVFAMWWLYFAKPAFRFLNSNRAGFVWGYGHYLIFASAAAVGAGLAVMVDHVTDHAALSPTTAAATFTMPVAIFLITVSVLHHRPHHAGRWHAFLTPVAAALVLLATFTSRPAAATGAILTALVIVATAVAIRNEARMSQAVQEVIQA